MQTQYLYLYHLVDALRSQQGRERLSLLSTSNKQLPCEFSASNILIGFYWWTNSKKCRIWKPAIASDALPDNGLWTDGAHKAITTTTTTS